jgi:hypothetical protein
VVVAHGRAWVNLPVGLEVYRKDGREVEEGAELYQISRVRGLG